MLKLLLRLKKQARAAAKVALPGKQATWTRLTPSPGKQLGSWSVVRGTLRSVLQTSNQTRSVFKTPKVALLQELLRKEPKFMTLTLFLGKSVTEYKKTRKNRINMACTSSGSSSDGGIAGLGRQQSGFGMDMKTRQLQVASQICVCIRECCW